MHSSLSRRVVQKVANCPGGSAATSPNFLSATARRAYQTAAASQTGDDEATQRARGFTGAFFTGNVIGNAGVKTEGRKGARLDDLNNAAERDCIFVRLPLGDHSLGDREMGLCEEFFLSLRRASEFAWSANLEGKEDGWNDRSIFCGCPRLSRGLSLSESPFVLPRFLLCALELSTQ